MVELIYLLLIIFFTIIVFVKDKNKLKIVGKGFKHVTLSFTPYVLAIILIASIIQVCVPQNIITRYLGEDNQIIAPVIAAFFGAIFDGPTIVAFVLGASLLESGASITAIIAFISSFSMVGLIAFPLEKKELGIRFTLVRFIVTVVFTVIIGIACGIIMKKI
ncbi:permease [Anaeromicropila populeti]|uniref:Predicted permease n=1 Tax=Anaeromicropila populeti TaxID=37658 RepID=A0A1I6K991_9FIRM|nr:permease [Anaeromicropila populeti]SFR87833.1 Predicted permease [Anaeromicropila populeti]